jgi:crossover junction endodeoxyribonuclease RusA
MNQLTVTLPLPPKELSPNARCHWRVKALKTQGYRADARALAFVALQDAIMAAPRWKAATMQVRWFTRTAHHCDPDNGLSCMKSAIDGLTDARIFSDDKGLTHLPIIFAKDAKNPRVELTITPTE